MRSIIRATVLATVSVLALGAAVEAKTLVYCSEGSPEGFSPMLFTAGTTFDASSKPIYNRLIEFEHGDTKTIPGLAESFTVSDDGLVYTFKLRQGVKWHSTARASRPRATSTPTTSCSRSCGSSTRTIPSTRSRAAPTSTSPAWTWATC